MTGMNELLYIAAGAIGLYFLFGLVVTCFCFFLFWKIWKKVRKGLGL